MESFRVLGLDLLLFRFFQRISGLEGVVGMKNRGVEGVGCQDYGFLTDFSLLFLFNSLHFH